MPEQELDSDGTPSKFRNGDRVYVAALNMEATVLKQILSYDGPDYCFWGNVELLYDDGVKGVSNSWQVKRIEE